MLAVIRDRLESRQIAIYFVAMLLAGLLAGFWTMPLSLSNWINPALAFMLYVTFLQVPIAQLGKALTQLRFLAVLLFANFCLIPLLVFALLPLLPDHTMLRLGVLLVLLTPCIDYVVTFAQLGRADSRTLLASTPVLLIVQMLLLPLYLKLALGEQFGLYIKAGPFLEAFFSLIVIPLLLAGATQYLAAKSRLWTQIHAGLGLAPVPATALVLFIVVAAVLRQLEPALDVLLRVLPVYVLFAIFAPVIAWCLARQARLAVPLRRAVVFSSATRNSLVVLPLALAIPGALPLLPAIILTQTLVELLAQLVYVRVVARWGQNEQA
ncbi:arsenic resistance protein [Alcaligenes pakistanensis]|uniref:Arsenic resistance protein n=1 Tax=Alcaligenes pakistanensis TaxID=1482717 RepID=A0A8H9IJ03_9BURK|nr:arsenic resistance protein [Alcaligenes pakistanensis]